MQKKGKLKPLGTGARVAGYLRDSGGRQQEVSVERQRQELLDYCAARGWVIVAWYIDEARSGTEADHRPPFQAMVTACRVKAPPYDAVLLWSGSRFARDEVDAPYYRADLRRHGVNVVSVTDQIPEGPLAGVFEALIDWKDAQFSRDLAEHVESGHRRIMAAGYIHAPEVAVGYRAVRVQTGEHRGGAPRYGIKWEIDPDRAPLVIRAFELRAAGATLGEIDDELHLHKARSSYTRMFASDAYLGVASYGAETYPGAMPALVPQALWLAAQRPGPKHRAGAGYLLSGLLRCPCGSVMSGRRTVAHGHEYRYYICSARSNAIRVSACPSRMLRAEAADADVLRLIEAEVLAHLPELVARAQAELRARDDGRELAGARRRAERAATSIARLAAAIADPDLDAAPLHAQLRQARETLGRAQVEVDHLQAGHAVLALTGADVLAAVDQMRADLASGELPRVRGVLVRLLDRIDVVDGRLILVPRELDL